MGWLLSSTRIAYNYVSTLVFIRIQTIFLNVAQTLEILLIYYSNFRFKAIKNIYWTLDSRYRWYKFALEYKFLKNILTFSKTRRTLKIYKNTLINISLLHLVTSVTCRRRRRRKNRIRKRNKKNICNKFSVSLVHSG